jgi:integrase
MAAPKHRIKFGDREVYFYRRKDTGQLVFGYKVGGAWKETRCPGHIRAQKEAEAYARAYLEEIERTGGKPQFMPPDPVQLAKWPTVAEIAERWLELRDANKDLAPATKGQDKSNVDMHIAPRVNNSEAPDPKLGDLRVEELGSAKLREWVRDLKSTKASSTVRNICNSLTTMLEDAMAEEWIDMPANPMKHPGVRKELPAVKFRGGNDRVYLTRCQAEALLRCEKVPEHRRVRYAVALTSGMRDGELAGLNWADVDLDAKPPRVEITKALALRGGEGFATLGDTKTEYAKRTLPLHALAVRSLRAWKSKGWAQFAGHKPRATDSVFPDEHGEPSRPRSAQLIRDDLETAKQPTKVGSADIDFHATRRSFLTWLTNAEVSSEIIDMLAGHAGKGVRARHYTARDLEVMAKAVTKIELDVTSGEVVSLPLAVAVGDETIIDDPPPDAVPTSVVITEDTQITGPLAVESPATFPAARGKRAGRRRNSSTISSAPDRSRTCDLRFRNRNTYSTKTNVTSSAFRENEARSTFDGVPNMVLDGTQKQGAIGNIVVTRRDHRFASSIESHGTLATT